MDIFDIDIVFFVTSYTELYKPQKTEKPGQVEASVFSLFWVKVTILTGGVLSRYSDWRTNIMDALYFTAGMTNTIAVHRFISVTPAGGAKAQQMVTTCVSAHLLIKVITVNGWVPKKCHPLKSCCNHVYLCCKGFNVAVCGGGFILKPASIWKTVVFGFLVSTLMSKNKTRTASRHQTSHVIWKNLNVICEVCLCFLVPCRYNHSAHHVHHHHRSVRLDASGNSCLWEFRRPMLALGDQNRWSERNLTAYQCQCKIYFKCFAFAVFLFTLCEAK